MTRLRAEGLSVTDARGHRLVAPLDLALEPGRATCLVGESGAGKSLVCAAIAATLPPDLRAGGRLWLDGRDIAALPPAARPSLWARQLFLLPQEPWTALAPARAALPQVDDMRRIHGGPPGLAARLMERMGLRPGPDGAKRPGQLSGGMAQRVAMAIALGAPAGIVMVDEPTKGLDPRRRGQVEAGLRALLGEGRAVLLVTHDIALARAIGDEIVILREGEAVERGPPARVLAAPSHPFTRALLAAQPERWAKRKRAARPPMLEVTDLAIRPARGAPILASGLRFSMAAGGITGLRGPSGSGKTTLGDTLLGLTRPAHGRIEWIGGGTGQKLFQDPGMAFAPWRPIGATLADALASAGRRRAAVGAESGALLRRLNLSPALLARRPSAVSGGELQRLSLARALLARPRFIFADEPTSRLDAISQQALSHLLCDVADTGTAILLASHDQTLLARMADAVIAIDDRPSPHPAGVSTTSL